MNIVAARTGVAGCKLQRCSSDRRQAEREILEILWQHGPRTIPQIVETFKRTRPTAYTTIKTTIEVLPKKGFVTRQRTARWAHTYTAAPRAVLLAAAFECHLAELGATPTERPHVAEALKDG